MGGAYSAFREKKNSSFRGYDKTIGRPQANPRHAGHVIKDVRPPDCPARTHFYDRDIPKFFPGQPGHAQQLADLKKAEERARAGKIPEWESHGEKIKEKLKLPGINDKN